ncbi:unnamed protein product, partial [Symbiodinium pilosum]
MEAQIDIALGNCRKTTVLKKSDKTDKPAPAKGKSCARVKAPAPKPSPAAKPPPSKRAKKA